MKKLKELYNAFIRNQYKKIALSELHLQTIQINVKKGNRKYFLIIAKSNEDKTVFHLNRHI